jgi:hypothetical protein
MSEPSSRQDREAVLRFRRPCPYPDWLLLELPDGYFAAFWAAGIEIAHAAAVARGNYREVCAFWSTDREEVLRYMAAADKEDVQAHADTKATCSSRERATMPEKLTIEVPDGLLRQFSELSHYVDGAKGHEQTRRLLIEMAQQGVAAYLSQQDAFYGGNYPSIIINGKILSKDEATAVCAAITRYGDALNDGEMGPIDRVRSIIGR